MEPLPAVLTEDRVDTEKCTLTSGALFGYNHSIPNKQLGGLMRYLFLLLLTGLFAMPVPAQDTSVNEFIARCNDVQISQIAETSAVFRETYDHVVGQIPGKITDLRMPELGEVGGSIHAMQVLWHTRIEGEMPDCALGMRMSHIYGRLIDEMLITYLSVEFESSPGSHDRPDLSTPIASDHAAAVDELRIEYDNINSELDSLVSLIDQALSQASCDCRH